MDIYWIKAEKIRIAVTSCPKGRHRLPTDIGILKRSGVDVLVSALTAHENEVLQLNEEDQCSEARGIEFLSFPIEDMSVPRFREKFHRLIETLSEHVRGRKSVAAHCYMGIGRSPTIVACVLVANGFTADAALRAIAEARGEGVPDTQEQIDWIKQFALSVRKG